MEINNGDTIQKMIHKMKNNERLCYVRYGDGDFISMYPNRVNKIVGANNQSYITKEIREKIIESYSIDREDYMVGVVQPGENSTITNIKQDIIRKLNLNHPAKLYSAISIQQSFLNDLESFIEFSRLLNVKKTLYINQYNEPILEKFIGKINSYIKVPKLNACSQYNDIIKLVMDTDTSRYEQIVLSCGQLARVIMKDLYENLPNKNIIDYGSVSDMLIINTDSFKKLNLRIYIRKNIDLIKQRVNYYETKI